MKNRCLSRAVLVHDVLEAVPLLLSTALAPSAAYAFVALTSNPLPSPALSAASADGLSNPVLVVVPQPPPLGVTVMIAVWLTP